AGGAGRQGAVCRQARRPQLRPRCAGGVQLVAARLDRSAARADHGLTSPRSKAMLGVGSWKQRMPTAEQALPGRAAPLPLYNVHHVHGRPLRGDFEGLERVAFGMGCFWGAERLFWALPGVETT